MAAMWGSFGCWELEVQRGHEAQAYDDALSRKEYDTQGPPVRRATWDGRDKILFLQVGHTPPLSAPIGWKGVLTVDASDALSAMEKVVPRVLEWAGIET